MIQSESILDVADNSGAKKLLCIKILGGSRKKFGYVGTRIKCSVKKSTPNSSVKKGDVVLAVIVRTKRKTVRDDGTVLCFDVNSAVIINEDGNPKGSRIFGPIPRELRSDYMKIISLSTDVV